MAKTCFCRGWMQLPCGQRPALGQQLGKPSLCTKSLLSISVRLSQSGDRTAGKSAVPGRVW